MNLQFRLQFLVEELTIYIYIYIVNNNLCSKKREKNNILINISFDCYYCKNERKTKDISITHRK